MASAPSMTSCPATTATNPPLPHPPPSINQGHESSRPAAFPGDFQQITAVQGPGFPPFSSTNINPQPQPNYPLNTQPTQPQNPLPYMPFQPQQAAYYGSTMPNLGAQNSGMISSNFNYQANPIMPYIQAPQNWMGSSNFPPNFPQNFPNYYQPNLGFPQFSTSMPYHQYPQLMQYDYRHFPTFNSAPSNTTYPLPYMPLVIPQPTLSQSIAPNVPSNMPNRMSGVQIHSQGGQTVREGLGGVGGRSIEVEGKKETEPREGSKGKCLAPSPAASQKNVQKRTRLVEIAAGKSRGSVGEVVPTLLKEDIERSIELAVRRAQELAMRVRGSRTPSPECSKTESLQDEHSEEEGRVNLEVSTDSVEHSSEGEVAKPLVTGDKEVMDTPLATLPGVQGDFEPRPISPIPLHLDD